MTPATVHRRHRSRGDSGGAVLELALVLPVFLTLILGIVDLVTAFDQQIGLRGGVREAAWNGSRGIFGAPADPACALTFGNVVPDANTQAVMCMVKRRSGLDPVGTRVRVRFVDLDDPAARGRYRNGQGVMVCAMQRVPSVTGFVSSLVGARFQRARLTTVVLSVDPAVITMGGGAERALPQSGGWGFCDPRQPSP